MGRPGAGSSSRGGGSSSSGGGHSSSRTSGGHRVGSSSVSSRPGQGTGSVRSSGGAGSGRGFGGGFHRNPPPPPPPRSPYRGSRGFGGYGRTSPHRSPKRGGSIWSAVAAVIVLLVFLAAFSGVMNSCSGRSSSSSGVGRSTIQRERLGGVSYTHDCIVDELGYLESTSWTAKELKTFYDKTGVQPYVVLHAYDSSLKTDSEKEAWARQYYDNYIANEGTFLYVYFEDSNPNEIGYMAYVNGKQVSSVMDSEAVGIFWNYLDKYWVTDMSMDEVLAKTFSDTASVIMKTPSNIYDVLRWVVFGVIILVVIVVLIRFWKAKQARDKERAAETERILNTPMQDLVGGTARSEADDLADLYK